ncbi:MAG: hypothetical protein B6U76_04305 [Desulfurococcales archaeon ex4484_217_2]|nr:MAG: hypothetical protein B6U76_04305 [Desulfurococcales archaeon ex4484_217_2]
MGERESEAPAPYYPPNETITSKPGRHIVTTIAAILFIISGIFSIIGVIALLILGGIAGVAVPGMGSLLGGTVAILGLVILVVGVLDFLAGYWLWKNLKKGGILGLISRFSSNNLCRIREHYRITTKLIRHSVNSNRLEELNLRTFLL